MKTDKDMIEKNKFWFQVDRLELDPSHLFLLSTVLSPKCNLEINGELLVEIIQKIIDFVNVEKFNNPSI